MKVKIIPIVIGAFGTVTIKYTGGSGSWRTSGEHPNYSIVENGQNTEKSPGDLWRHANALDYNFIVSEFKLQTGYFFHFWTNIFWKGMHSHIPLAMG